MKPFKQYFLESDQFSGRYTFHETDIQSAILILKSGKIKGKFIDDAEARKDLQDVYGKDYGEYVYTSTFTQDTDDYSFMGFNDPGVLFVIDTHKLSDKGRFEAAAENGLLKIPRSIPLSAVILVAESNKAGQFNKELRNLCEQRGIKFQYGLEDFRISLITHYRK